MFMTKVDEITKTRITIASIIFAVIFGFSFYELDTSKFGETLT